MSNVRKITATAIMLLLVFGIWSSVTHSQDERGRRRLPDEGISTRKNPPARSEPTPPESPAQPDTPELPNPQPSAGAMSAEEKLVRDVYARVMRYQSAARDELAARNGLSTEPDDYLTFELRHIHTGPIEEIYYRPLTEIATGSTGATINLTPTHLSNGNDPAHAYYEARWTQLDIDVDIDDPTIGSVPRPLKRAINADEEPLYPVDESFTTRTNTVGEMLRKGGKRYANVEKYTSYEVTVHLDGKLRTYRALVLHHGQNAWDIKKNELANGANAPARQVTAEILDNITSEMNTVLNDESPRVQSPWTKYVNTSLYVAVTRTIMATKAAGRPLKPADAPIGYLPGDDVAPSKRDMQTLMASAPCATGVDRIQYLSNSAFVDISETLYIPKGQSVTFRAAPSPADATFPAGQPVWAGSYGASGSGETTSVTFTTLSSSTKDYKTVTATSGNTVTVNVIVYELNLLFTPDDNFSGRSHNRFGLQEHVSLSFTPTPQGITADQAGGLKWKLNGGGVLNAPNSDGTGTYDATETEGQPTLKLEVQTGPAQGGGYNQTITIVKPSGGYEVKEGGTYLKHFQNTWSVGFRGVIHLLPTDVSFLNLSFIEDDVGAQATGWLIGLNNQGHNPKTIPTVIGSGNIDTGCEVLYGDEVFTGAIPGPNYGDGTVSWTIPWNIITRGDQPHRVSIGSVVQYATSDSAGKATIKKAGSATYSANASDYSSGYDG